MLYRAAFGPEGCLNLFLSQENGGGLRCITAEGLGCWPRHGDLALRLQRLVILDLELATLDF